MSITAGDIVAEARSWKGTPFHWQASLKGVGCDCKGLVAGVARELGMPEGGSLYASIGNYDDRVPVALLKKGLAATFDRAPSPEPGDVLLLKVGGKAQHLGIFTGASVVHCFGRGKRQVIETPASVVLRAFPLDSIWRWRSI